MSPAGRSSFRLWGGSALLALTLHGAGLTTLFVSLAPEDSDAVSGAPVETIAFEAQAPRPEDADLAPGPGSDSSIAALDSAREPSKELASRFDDSTSSRKDFAHDAKESSRSQESQDTTPPPMDSALRALSAKGPDIGLDRNAQRAMALWRKDMALHLGRFKRSPPEAAQRTLKIIMRFTIDGRGHVISADIASSSGAQIFDEAALAMIQRADPFPPPPNMRADESLSLSVPIVFQPPRNRL